MGVGLERLGQREMGQEGAESRNAGGGAHCVHKITYPCIAAAFIETPIEITQKASHPQTVVTSQGPRKWPNLLHPTCCVLDRPPLHGHREIWSNCGVFFEMYKVHSIAIPVQSLKDFPPLNGPLNGRSREESGWNRLTQRKAVSQRD